MDYILFFKGLHVIGFVSWFAGLFYLGRVLVNHAEITTIGADGTGDAEYNRIKREVLQEEYAATADRVYRIIVHSAMWITLIGGFSMVGFNPGYLQSGTPGWLVVKIGLVFGMMLYQAYTKAKLMKPMASGTFPWESWHLRLWNEVPTFFLVSIPFLAVYGKVGQLNYLYLAVGVALFGLMVYRGAVAYRKKRLAAEK